MTTSGWSDADPTAAPALGARRGEVLGVVRESPDPVSVADVAVLTGLHVNTARFHLDRLVDEGRATRSAERSGSRGRPRILYSPTPDPEGPHGYRMLADVMSGLVRSLDPQGAAVVEAGRAWGRRLAGDTAQDTVQDTAEDTGQEPASAANDPLARLEAVLGPVGFGQTRHDRGTDTELRIHHCPFLAVAGEHPDAVCTLHGGLVEGALAELGGTLELAELRPFATPTTCVARLRDQTGSSLAGTRAAVSENRATPPLPDL